MSQFVPSVFTWTTAATKVHYSHFAEVFANDADQLEEDDVDGRLEIDEVHCNTTTTTDEEILFVKSVQYEESQFFPSVFTRATFHTPAATKVNYCHFDDLFSNDADQFEEDDLDGLLVIDEERCNTDGEMLFVDPEQNEVLDFVVVTNDDDEQRWHLVQYVGNETNKRPHPDSCEWELIDLDLYNPKRPRIICDDDYLT